MAGTLRPPHDPHIDVDRRGTGNTHGEQKVIGAILHCTVSKDARGTDDIANVLAYLERTPERLGVHRCIDADGNVGAGAEYHQVAYHCGGANTGYVGFELVGMTWYNWPARSAQLEKLARHLAWLHVHFGMPLQYGPNGVRQHRDVHSPLSMGHTDISGTFPINRVLRRARQCAEQGW